MLVASAEVMALAQRMGLDLAKTLDVIEQSSGQSWIGTDRMRRAIAGDWSIAKGKTETIRHQLVVYSGAVNDLALITGQKPEIRKATKSIAQFKLREGQPIGAHVTLRGDRMWEFLDRLLSLALPRIRDFRGLSPKQFDGHGNYTFGLAEQSVFHEIDVDSIDRPRGMDITVVTSATNDDEGRALLRALGFPFKEN